MGNRKTDPEKVQAMHDEFHDWAADPKGKYDFMQYSPTAEKYWCKQHILLLNPGSAANHAKEHQKSNSLKSTKPGKLSAADKRLIDAKKLEAEKNSEVPEELLTETTSEMLINSVSKAWADEMAGLIKDPQLIYGYQRLHDEGLLPYDWGIGTFLKACFKEWMENYFITFEMNVDMDKMSENRREFIMATMNENKIIRDRLEEQIEPVELETPEPEIPTTEEKSS